MFQNQYLLQILNLRKKVDAGADFLISQLFLDNEFFYQFVERCRIANINVPIQAGIMPVVNKKQIERLVSLCGASKASMSFGLYSSIMSLLAFFSCSISI